MQYRKLNGVEWAILYNFTDKYNDMYENNPIIKHILP